MRTCKYCRSPEEEAERQKLIERWKETQKKARERDKENRRKNNARQAAIDAFAEEYDKQQKEAESQQADIQDANPGHRILQL